MLGPNIQTFHDNNAIGVFEEAQYQTGSSEFNEMKTWVVTKLLWNPKLDFNQLVAQFIKDYYGQAAPQMQAYYDLCQSLVTPDKHFGIYIRHNDPIFSDEFVQKGEAIFKEALSKAENDEIRERVEKERMQIVWLKFQRNRPQSLTDGTWDELKKMMLHFTARPMEPRSQEYMIEEIDNERQKLLNKK